MPRSMTGYGRAKYEIDGAWMLSEVHAHRLEVEAN